MKPAVIKVEPKRDYLLLLTFENSEQRIFDMNPYLDTGLFAELKNIDVFNTVRISFDTVQWANQLDFDPEALYDLSKPLEKIVQSV